MYIHIHMRDTHVQRHTHATRTETYTYRHTSAAPGCLQGVTDPTDTGKRDLQTLANKH
jgi:hypothetical protein